MSILTKVLGEFDEDDVRAMDEALRKFADYKKDTGLPDYSPGFVAYTPILSFALLRSQSVIEKLTLILCILTCFLGLFASAQIGLMIWTIIPPKLPILLNIYLVLLLLCFGYLAWWARRLIKKAKYKVDIK